MTKRSASRERRSATAQLRMAFFSRGGAAAIRYEVNFERVLRHLWSARNGQRHVALQAVRHIEDLIHAAACVDGRSIAWSDLADHYEPPLIRQCSAQLGSTQAIVAVRRLLSDLKRRSVTDDTPPLPSLRTYRGVEPLRTWMSDRLVGMVTRERMLATSPRPARSESLQFAETGPVVAVTP